MFSDNLVSWRPSSSRCSTRFGSCSDHGFRCMEIIAPHYRASRIHTAPRDLCLTRLRIGVWGRLARLMGRLGDRRFTLSSRNRPCLASAKFSLVLDLEKLTSLWPTNRLT